MSEKIQKKDPFDRPPRLQKSFKPLDLDMPSPPTKEEEAVQNFLMSLLPMSSYLVMGLFYATSMRSSGSAGMGMGIMMLLFPIFMIISTYFTTGEQKHQKKQNWIKQLRKYQRLLDKKESRLIAGRELQQVHLHERFLTPRQLLDRVKKLETNLWERRPDDPDFLTYRIGIGEDKSVVGTKPPDPDTDSKFIRRPVNLHTEYRKLPDVPITFDLQKIGSIAFVGDRNNTIPMAQSVITQIATLNSPEDLHLYIFSGKLYYRIWKWLRWLPQTSDSHQGGRPTFLAFTSNSRKKLLNQIAQTLDNLNRDEESKSSNDKKLAQSMVLFFDKEEDLREEALFSYLLKNGKNFGIYSVFICEKMEDVPSECKSVVRTKNNNFTFSLTGIEGYERKGSYDKIRLLEVDNMAHRLLPIAARSLGRSASIPPKVDMLQLYGATQVEEVGIIRNWLKLPEPNGLLPNPVSIGNESYIDHLSIHLAENKDGPHGLVAGTTGSGKSELLQTIVTALAIEHHPYYVNFLLIDFKGGSTFNIFRNLPHVVGLVSNLDKPSANRALEAIKAENLRRQQFLDDQGDEVDDIIEYHKKLARKGRKDANALSNWDPLPHLFIVVDEFAQMAKDMPKFLPELVEVGRIGRSLGIHLILATQRPAGSIKEEMRANLNFRISLRVQSIEDSKDVLNRPDAAHLPHDLPGRAYFQLGDTGVARQFQVARVGGEYDPDTLGAKELSFYELNYEEKTKIQFEEDDVEDIGADKDVLAAVLANQMVGVYEDMGFNSMEQILLPPLEKEIPIQKILCGESWKDNWQESWRREWANDWKKKEKEIDTTNEKAHSMFSAPIGLLDALSERSQPPFYLDFLKRGGNAVIIGAPQTGKTFFLESLTYSLVAKYSPAQINIYILSFAGKGLNNLEKLPHVGAVMEGTESERLQRLLRYLENQIEARKTIISKAGAKDLAEFNLQANSKKQLPFIVTMIDGFGELRTMEYDEELAAISQILKLGRELGIYFVLTASQHNDLSYKILNLIQQRIALELIDQSEYILLVGRLASTDFGDLPKGRAFVNISTPPQICQIGMPPQKEEWLSMSTQMIKEFKKTVYKRIIPEMIELATDISLLELLEKNK